MKKDTPTLLKFRKLQRRLGLPMWQVIGIIEALWYVTICNTPAGDIGKFCNADIAELMEYTGDVDALMDALTSEGWLDKSAEHRLVVHDWHEHCPTYLKGAFAKHGKVFASAKQCAKHKSAEKPENPAVSGPDSAKHGATYPIPSNSSQSPPPPPHPIPSEWAEVAVELSKLGVARSRDALNAAREAGNTPQDIVDVIEHWRSSAGKWDQGALYYRIKNAFPGMAASDGWLPSQNEAPVHRRMSRREVDDGWQVDCVMFHKQMRDSGLDENQIEEKMPTLKRKYYERAGLAVDDGDNLQPLVLKPPPSQQ